jgi:predicted Zn-dependent protease
MSTAPRENYGDGAAAHGYVRFTRAGEAALDALASRLAAEAGDSPEGIARVLDRILRVDVADLAGELARTTADQNRRTEPATVQTPDQAARRRLARHRDAPTGSTPPASPSVDP